MHVDQSFSGGDTTFKVGKSFRPVPIIIAALAMAAVPQVALMIAIIKVPLILMGLLAAVLVSCAALAAVALDELAPVTIRIGEDELTWSTLLASRTISWRHVSKIELVPVEGTFGSSSLEQGVSCVGVKIAVLSTAPGKPEEELLLAAGPAEDANELSPLLSAMQSARRPAKSGAPQRPRGISKPVTPSGEFRRRPSAVNAGEPQSAAG